MRELKVLRSFAAGLGMAGTLAFLPAVGSAAEIGTAMDVDPSAIIRVSGAARPIISGNRVSQGDVIQTRRSGQVQLLFDDHTRIVVGPNSRLVIDSVLMKSKRSASRFAVTAVKGSFRFISGRSSKSAYQIRTPTATMGVRGTVFDFAVNGGRETDLAVLNGSVRFCGRGGQCQEVRSGCSLIFADRRGGLRVPRTAEEGAQRIRNGFPYLFSQRTLMSAFRASTGACGRYLRLNRSGGAGGTLQRINTPAPGAPAPGVPPTSPPGGGGGVPDPTTGGNNPGASGNNATAAANTAGKGNANSRNPSGPGKSGSAPGRNK